LRIGFSEIDPPADQDPSDEQVQDAVRGCWDNSYYTFGDRVGTSLICVQGDWSNVVDGKIKGRFAALAHRDASNAPYNPLYARAFHVPRPWGVTALLSEYTGSHPPLEIEWNVERLVSLSPSASSIAAAAAAQPSQQIVPLIRTPQSAIAEPVSAERTTTDDTRPFASFWEFARALNRSDPTAIELASNGAECSVPLEVPDIRKLLSTFWVRSVFPLLSTPWRDRMLETLVQSIAIPDYAVRNGRQRVRVSELTHEELKKIVTGAILPDAIRRDLQLLVAVGTLWGGDAVKRFDFTPISDDVQKPSRLESLLEGFRSTSTSEPHSDHRH
jgi:hypothetical protein